MKRLYRELEEILFDPNVKSLLKKTKVILILFKLKFQITSDVQEKKKVEKINIVKETLSELLNMMENEADPISEKEITSTKEDIDVENGL